MHYEVTLKILIYSHSTKSGLRVRWNLSLSSERSVNQSWMASDSLKLHDFQVSVLNEHPPLAVTEEELRTFCPSRQIVVAAKKLLNGFKAKNLLTLDYPRNSIKTVYIQPARFWYVLTRVLDHRYFDRTRAELITTAETNPNKDVRTQILCL